MTERTASCAGIWPRSPTGLGAITFQDASQSLPPVAKTFEQR
jgi:hypothetical protein